MTATGLYLDRTKERITPAGLENSSTWLVPAGSVLLSMYATIGATAINRIPVSTNQAILAIIPTKDHWPEFLVFCLRAHKEALSARNIQATQKNINKGIVETFPLPLPPLREQRKIAAVLGLVQQAMEQQERLIEKTAELKRTLLHQLFTRGCPSFAKASEGKGGEPQKQTDLGPVPESWELVALGKLAKVGNGSTPKRDNASYWEGGTIPWLNSARIHDRFITEADQFVTDLAAKECHLPRVKSGSLLVAITGQGKTLGNTALVRFETCINQHLAYAQFTSDRVLPEFVLWFMQTRYEHLRSISQAGGSTKGALTCGYLKTYLIPVPALEEQKEIAATFAALDAKEKHHRRKHATLSALFRTMLHQLMTAQLRVHDLDLSEFGLDAVGSSQQKTRADAAG
jgi:type I restriction enzyme S subunit